VSDEAARLLADTARGLADHLRFHQALGIRELPVKQDYLAGPDAALRRLETTIAGSS